MLMSILKNTLKTMADKIVALFVEGPTEIEFYKAVVKQARDKMQIPYNCSIKYEDMKGIGNYKKDALRKLNNLKRKNPDSDIFVFLCIDSDAFEFSKKPPFQKSVVQKELLDAGAKKVTYVVAKHSIEDWFLSDLKGVLTYLHLPVSTKRPKGTGQEALIELFKKANKVYVKGGRTEGFIEKINVAKISQAQCLSLKPLCSGIGFDCKKVCGKD